MEALLLLITFFVCVEQIGGNMQQCEQMYAEGENAAKWNFCYLSSLLLFELCHSSSEFVLSCQLKP